MSATFSLSAVNDLSPEAFVERFGSVAENAPWVAEAAELERPFGTPGAMASAFQQAVIASHGDRQLALLRGHPSLAGRAALAGEVAEHSRHEQAGAGLDTLSPDEFARFTDLNGRYESRFGFPFILAVKGADKHAILQAFEARVGGTPVEERLTALVQVCRIMRFRLEGMISG